MSGCVQWFPSSVQIRFCLWSLSFRIARVDHSNGVKGVFVHLDLYHTNRMSCDAGPWDNIYHASFLYIHLEACLSEDESKSNKQP